jgi:osomolarity two-component system response regulator SSK1
MFFRRKKIKYQTAKDGVEAVEKWRTGGFHLILVRYPRMVSQLTHVDGHPAACHGRHRGDKGDSQARKEQQHRRFPKHTSG